MKQCYFNRWPRLWTDEFVVQQQVRTFFLFLFLRKHLSTRINRISFTILSNRKKVEIHDIYVFGVSFISRKIICKKRGFIFSFLNCQYRAITIIFTFKNPVLMGKKKEKGNNTCFTKISRNSVQHLQKTFHTRGKTKLPRESNKEVDRKRGKNGRKILIQKFIRRVYL